MRIISILTMTILLGSCIHSPVIIYPKHSSASTADCDKLTLQIEALIDQVTKDTTPVEPPVVANITIPYKEGKECVLPHQLTFEIAPPTPRIRVNDTDDNEAMLDHIDVLLTHIEELNNYIEHEHTELQKNHRLLVEKCTQ